jgi:hypothetical protein
VLFARATVLLAPPVGYDGRGFFAAGFAPALGYLVPPVVGLLDAGVELERLTTGLRAVDGRALAEGFCGA